MILDDKLKKLKEILESYGQMLVALSGGVDSVFLLVFAHKLWGDDRVAALTADGPHFANDELTYAKQLCEALGISHKRINADDVLSTIRQNPPDRCYLCKKEIFLRLKERADMRGCILADGTNLDDLDDYRPGYQALQELGVANPLKDAALTKMEIRQALKILADEDEQIAAALTLKNGTPIWEKPAFACLASRIPYGELITVEKLNAIYEAEVFLQNLGIAQVRVRHHGDVARIEVLPEDRNKFCDISFMDQVNEGIKKCGFSFAALDLGGYQMGNLNKLTTDGQADKHGDRQTSHLGNVQTPSGNQKNDTGNVHTSQINNDQTHDDHQNQNGRRTYNLNDSQAYDFNAFTDIIARLRAPDGCPWDIKQTHESLKECLIEESGEVISAIDKKDDANLCEELGDLLLQVVMHAQIAAEGNRFTIEDVIQGVSEKMIRRHPYVFGDVKISSLEEGLDLWNAIKEKEKAGK